MVGTNTLTLNAATVNAALEKYLKEQMPATPLTVTAVKQNEGGRGMGSAGPTFDITIECPAQTTPAA